MKLSCRQRLTTKNAVPAAIFLILITLTAEVFGASLSDYRTRLVTARESILTLSKVDYTDDEFRAMVLERVSSVRRTIPRTETIEVGAGAVETNNSWLHDDLDLYLNEANIANRDAIVRMVADRLLGIEAAITDVTNATSGSTTKDDEEQKIAEILRRQEYQKPKDEGESLFQKWRREFLEWLAKMFPEVEISPNAPSDVGSFATILQILLYGVLAAVLGFLLYRFLPFFAPRFGRRKRKSTDDRIILGERVSADQSAADLFAEAERFARDGELRLAIRKGYVALLCDLADRKVIGLARHKTNRDYLSDIRKKNRLFENMKRITASFERHWYGSQTADQREWEEFREQYQKTVSEV